MHLVGFIIRIYHDARSPKRQIRFFIVCVCVCVSVCLRALAIGGEQCVLTHLGALVPVCYVLYVLLFPGRDLTFNVDGSRKKKGKAV